MSKTLEILKQSINNNDISKLIFDFSFDINKPIETGLYEKAIKYKKLTINQYIEIFKNRYIPMINYYIKRKKSIWNFFCCNKYEFDFNSGLVAACNAGNFHFIYLMIGYGANDFNEGLLAACTGGHIEIVKFMIQLGARAINNGLFMACVMGNINVIELLINIGTHIGIINLNMGLYGACKGEKIHIVKLMIEKGAWDFESALIFTKNNKNRDIINLLKEHML